MTCSHCGRVYQGTVPLRCECGMPLAGRAPDIWEPTVELMPLTPANSDNEPTIVAGAPDHPMGLAPWPEPTVPFNSPPPGGHPYQWYAVPPPPPAELLRRNGRRRLLSAFAVLILGALFCTIVGAVALASRVNPTGIDTTNLPAAQATKTPPPTSTIAPTATPPLGSNFSVWDQGSNCQLQDDGFYVTGNSAPYLCLAPTAPISGGTAQVDLTFTKGDPTQAIGLAVNIGDGSKLTDDEIFLVNANAIMVLRHQNGRTQSLVPMHFTNLVHSGKGATNTLAVTVDGDQLIIDVNGEHALTVTDDASDGSGSVGLAVWRRDQEGIFNNFSLTSN